MEKFKTVYELNLSARALNSIKQASIDTTQELFSLSINDMTKLKFGRKTILEIEELKKTLINTPTESAIDKMQIPQLSDNTRGLNTYLCVNGELIEALDGEYLKLEDVLKLFGVEK